MALIIEPFPFVLCTIDMELRTLPSLLVILPVPYVDVTICANQSSESILHIIDKIAIVTATIWPDLRPTSMSDGAGPLTSVSDAVKRRLLGMSSYFQTLFIHVCLTYRIIPLKIL